jgi:hypothetical protein
MTARLCHTEIVPVKEPDDNCVSEVSYNCCISLSGANRLSRKKKKEKRKKKKEKRKKKKEKRKKKKEKRKIFG